MAKKAAVQRIAPQDSLKPGLPFLVGWRKYRENITQDELADVSGVSQGMISQLETRTSDYTGVLLEKLATGLECEPADIIGGNPMAEGTPWRIWAKLKPAQRRQAVRLLKALLEEDAA